MKSNYLICYDIADPVRLAKVLKYMKGRGVHIQYSVFLCTLTYPKLKATMEDLKDFINVQKDDIRIYPLPSCGRVQVLGLGARIPEGVGLFIDDINSWKGLKPTRFSM